MKSTSRHWSHRLLAILLVAATVSPLVLGVSVMEGCKKKAPPPPPPAPQGPPPPPPEIPVDFKAVAQTMKADRRVAFAPGVRTTKQPLAEAVVSLADGLARGDDKKFSALIDPTSRNQVKSMVASQTWQEATKKIEAVRIVRIIDGAESTPIEQAPALGSDVQDAMVGVLMKNLPDSVKAELTKELGHEPRGSDMDKILVFLDAKNDEMKASGLLTEEQIKNLEPFEAMVAKIKSDKEKKQETSTPSSGMYTVTLAVQEPGVAYAVGWIAVEVNGQWTFKASSVSQQANQRRASDFDVLFSTDSGSAPSEGENSQAPTGG